MSYMTDSNAMKEISTGLTQFLANSSVLYMKTHTFHWNIEGDRFYSLHLLFEKQYNDLWKSLDEIAERIRALGFKVPVSYSTLLGHAEMKEAEATPSENIMLKTLMEDNFYLSQEAMRVAKISEKHGDLATTDMLTKRSFQLEKNAWMLKSSLKEN